MASHDDDLPYRVDVWDDKDTHIEETIALTSDYATAKSAYEEAVKRRPGAGEGASDTKHAEELTPQRL
jgi:hypothetical protein